MLCKYGCGKEAKFKLKNGSSCCEDSVNKCSAVRKKNSEKQKISYNLDNARIILSIKEKNCIYCNESISIQNISKHEMGCYLNPINLKLCPECNKPIKDFRHNKTCSSKCSRHFFKEMYHEFSKMDRNLSYRTLCFNSNDKKCIVCSESNIVTVHHYNGNHDDNSPDNLVPLCPTHHMYCHSKFYSLIKKQVEDYVSIRKDTISLGDSNLVL